MNSNRLRYAAATVGLVAMASCAAVGGAAASSERAVADKNIVETASSTGQFKTLVSLVKRAGLARALSGSDKLTVFAPSDKAFAKVPTATLQQLRRNRSQLRAVLLYHVVTGDVRAGRVVKLRRARTLNGASIRIGVKGSRVYLNRTTRVVRTDVAASNGTIHVIDRVLIPPAR